MFCRRFKILLLSLMPLATATFAGTFDQETGFDKSQCDKTKGCFLFPTDCDPMKTCEIAASYQLINVSNQRMVQFELLANTEAYAFNTSTGGWVALGFSLDQTMANTPVTECSPRDGERLFGRLSFNVADHNNQPITDVSVPEGTLMTEVNKEFDGRIYCILRQIVDPGPGLNGRVVNLDNPFYLLLAMGRTTKDETALSHHIARTYSNAMVKPTETVSAIAFSSSTIATTITTQAAIVIFMFLMFRE